MHSIVRGIDYRNSEGLNALKHEIGSCMTGGISFIDIYEIFPMVEGEEKRVIMFQIPAAITAVPTGWNNQEYARNGESLVPLSEEKRERIRRQVKLDWSKRFVSNATLEHLDKDAAAHLRKHKLVEGRINSLYLAAPLAKTAEDKAQYIKNRAFDNKYYQDMIVNYLREFGKANKAALRDLLIDKFPDTLSASQKERKVLTLLTALKRKGIITTDSENKKISQWILVKKSEKN